MTKIITEPAAATRRVSGGTLIGLGIGFGALIALALALFNPPAPISFGPPLVAHVSGMLAGYGIAVMLAIMSRAPMIERAIGADALARWHGRFGPLIIILVAVHAVAAVRAWADVRGQGTAAALAELLTWPGLISATFGLLLLLVVGAVSVRLVRRQLSHEHWQLAHLLTYLAAGLGFTHQLAGPNLVGSRPAQIGWSLLYAYAFALVLRYRVLQPLHQLLRHRLRVAEVTRESADVIHVVMTGRHLDELRAEPGQFFRWRFLTGSMWHSAYPFSLSAAPTNDRLRITVKALGTGSKSLRELRPGTVVLAEGPYGVLTSRRRRRLRVLLIAGGVGITPMRTLFETLELPGEDLTLVYRAASEKDLVLRDELDEIAARKGARVIYVLGPTTIINRLTANSLTRMVGDLDDYDIYLCGPARMTSEIRDSLLWEGHPRRQLHEERFG
jgi:predicted ferric reductase